MVKYDRGEFPVQRSDDMAIQATVAVPAFEPEVSQMTEPPT